ncbi:MAG: hypothetical protein NZ693_00090 [Thermoflexales bacterium]|nr:hypothetical protein [Thermoflexales bacterium]
MPKSWVEVVDEVAFRQMDARVAEWFRTVVAVVTAAFIVTGTLQVKAHWQLRWAWSQ